MEANRGGKTYFEQQREALVGDISTSLEHVLANINKLNRSLEAAITVGNEFSSVEALWSQFEGVMVKDQKDDGEGTQGDKQPGDGHEKQKEKREGAESASGS